MKPSSLLTFSNSWALLSLVLGYPITDMPPLWASACCSRSAATPLLILGDEQFQLNFGISQSKRVAETHEDGVPIFGSPDQSETQWNYRIDTTALLTDRLQWGCGVSWVQHQLSRGTQQDSGMGVGDMRLSLGYEALPLWNYSPWQPQGFLFSVMTLPMGRSIYESTSPTGSDVTGNGFYSISTGSLFLKRWTYWDFFLITEIHYSLPRNFTQSGMTLLVKPGFGASLGLGTGWSPKAGPLRFGIRIQPRYDQPRVIPNMMQSVQTQGYLSVWDTGIDVSYLFSGNNSFMFSYTDQTLLGEARNSQLNRTAAILFQHRWLR